MSMNLHINDVLISQKGKKIRIKELISDTGGQGMVYLVDYDGREKILKWYKEEYLCDLRKRPPVSSDGRRAGGIFRLVGKKVNVDQAFYDNLCKNTMIWESGRNPASWNFVWPEDMTEWDGREDSSFGYIMEKIPSERYPLIEKFFVFNVGFTSREIMLTACLNMLKAFECLHNEGYSYQDINEGNIYICPSTGDVLIADTDNVTKDGCSFSIKGTDGFKAPEIWMGELPSAASDRFSLAVVLFRLLMGSVHPLDGLYSLEKDNIYITQGKDPVFIFDKKDKRNRACREKHQNAMILWPQYPEYIHELFERVFSSATIKKKNMRPTETEWIDALVRLRGEIMKCPYCEAMLYVEAGEEQECPCCHWTVSASPYYLLYQGRNISLTEGKIIYRCQWDTGCRNFKEPFLKVTRSGWNDYELRNMSEDIWTVVYQDGRKIQISYDMSVGLFPGMEIRFGGKRFIVHCNT